MMNENFRSSSYERLVRFILQVQLSHVKKNVYSSPWGKLNPLKISVVLQKKINLFSSDRKFYDLFSV